MLRKIINGLLALLFMAFAFVQVNDPDPLVWIAIYGSTAVACIMAMYRYYPRPYLAGLLVLFLVYLAFLFPGMVDWYRSADRSLLFDDVAKMQYPYIEEAREFLGLALCAIAVAVYLVFGLARPAE
ncbi:MAG: transmembrane 220 family protein [Cyclobacteriaceae bacterium]|jgi:hypothetical protein|nr:transmembrane 220 family protein [Cyclobacteriaceae bacterium]